MLIYMISIRPIGPVGRVFANGPGDRGSIPGRVILKTFFKMVLDTSLLNTLHYKVRIKGKVEQSRERNCALPNTSVWYLLKRESSGCPRLQSSTLLTINDFKYSYLIIIIYAQLYDFKNSYLILIEAIIFI